MADTSLQHRQTLQQFDGRLSWLYLWWREEMICVLVHAKDVIDFGDDELLDEDKVDGAAGDGWGWVCEALLSQR